MRVAGNKAMMINKCGGEETAASARFATPDMKSMRSHRSRLLARPTACNIRNSRTGGNEKRAESKGEGASDKHNFSILNKIQKGLLSLLTFFFGTFKCASQFPHRWLLSKYYTWIAGANRRRWQWNTHTHQRNDYPPCITKTSGKNDERKEKINIENGATRTDIIRSPHSQVRIQLYVNLCASSKLTALGKRGCLEAWSPEEPNNIFNFM